MTDEDLKLEKARPYRITSLNNIVSVASGLGHTIAIGSDGSIWSWGINDYGQLGDGGNKIKRKPEGGYSLYVYQ